MTKVKRAVAAVLTACMTFTFIPTIYASAAKEDIVLYDYNDFSKEDENKLASPALGFEDNTAVSYGADADGTTYMRIKTAFAAASNTTTPYVVFPINGGNGIKTEKDRRIGIEVRLRTDTQTDESTWEPDVRLQLKYNMPESSAELENINNPDTEGHGKYNAAYNDCNLLEIAGGGFRAADGYVTDKRQTCMKALDMRHEKDTWYRIRAFIDPTENSADYEITNCRTGEKKTFLDKKLYFPIGDKLESIAFASFKNAVPTADIDYIRVYDYCEGEVGVGFENSSFEAMRKPGYSVTDPDKFYITSEEAKSGFFSACVSGESYYVPINVTEGRVYAVSAYVKADEKKTALLTADGAAISEKALTDGEWTRLCGIYKAEKTGEVKLSTACDGEYLLDDLYFEEVLAEELSISGADGVCRGESAEYELNVLLQDGGEMPAEGLETEASVYPSGSAAYKDGVLSISEAAPIGNIMLKLYAPALGIEAQKSIEVYDAVQSELIYTDADGKELRHGLSADCADCTVRLTNKSDAPRDVNIIGAMYDGDKLSKIVGKEQVTLSAGECKKVPLGRISDLGEQEFRVFCWQDMSPTALNKAEKKQSITDELYVAPWGSDAAEGSLEKPLATLEAARDKIRESVVPKGGVCVYIRGGEYKRNGVFTLSARDSGSADRPITYKAYKDEKPTFTQGTELNLSAAQKVTDAQMLKALPSDDAREHLYVINLSDFGISALDAADYTGKYTASVNAWISEFKKQGKAAPDEVPTTPTNEVFFDNEPMTVARYPNEGGWLKVKNKNNIINNGAVPRYWEENMSASSKYVPEEDRDLCDTFTFKYEDSDPSYMKRWENTKDALMFGFWYHCWATQTVGLAKVNTEDGTLTSDIPSYFGLQNDSANPYDYAKYYVFNLPEEIDTAGEYYLDRENLKLYFYKSEEMTDDKSMYISDGRYSFLNISGAEYVTFEGIDFNIGRTTGITVNSNNVTIRDCTVRNLSSNAVYAAGDNNLVTGCRIQNTDGGVTITSGAGYGYKNNFKHSNSRVENCTIESFSRKSLVYTNAITLSGVGNSAVNNTMSNSYHMAASVSGQDNRFSGNEIYNVCRYASDAAAVYFGRSWTDRGNEISGNYIHDLHPDPEWAKTYGVNAVFADDNFAGASIFGNIFENIDGYAVKFNGCQDNRVENNVFINCRGRDNLPGGALNAVKTGSGADRLSILKSACIDQVNGLMSVGYFNDCWESSEFAAESTETINGISVSVPKKMSFVAAISSDEWAENEAENIKKYINPIWHEKFPEIYLHLKYNAGESQNNTFINNLLINCDESKIDALLTEENRLKQENTVLPASAIQNGTVDRTGLSAELNKIRTRSADCGSGGAKPPEAECGVVVYDDCADIGGWENSNPQLGTISSGVDADGTTYVRLFADKDSTGANTNAAMVYSFTDKNIAFSDSERIVIESRFRFSATDEDDATDTGPYLAFRYNMPRNTSVGLRVRSLDSDGNEILRGYSNGAYDLTLAAMTGGKFAYMNGQAKNGDGKYISVAAMKWTAAEGYNPLSGKTRWLTVKAEPDMTSKTVSYSFYDEEGELLLQTAGELANYTPDGYLNNLGFATMNGYRGTAEIDVDYIRVTKEAK